MAVYPVNQGGKGSRVQVAPDSGVKISPMADGSIRGYSDYADVSYTLTIEHWWLNVTDRDAVLSFYDTDPFALHSVVAQDEGTFDVRFTNRPVVSERSGNYSKVVSVMIGTKV